MTGSASASPWTSASPARSRRPRRLRPGAASSAAAFLVKVRPSTRSARTMPLATSQTRRAAIVSLLPDPAPAMTACGPSPAPTTAACSAVGSGSPSTRASCPGVYVVTRSFHQTVPTFRRRRGSRRAAQPAAGGSASGGGSADRVEAGVEVDAVGRRDPDQLAPQDEDLQVGGGLADGEELVHRVEFGEPALPAGPRQRGGHGEGADRAGRRDLERLPEPDLVVREQLVPPGVGGCEDGGG